MSELPKKQSGIFKWIIIGVIVIGIAGAALGDKDNSVKRVDSSEDTIQKESRKRHPYEYEKYLPDTGLIINSPDYVGLSPKDSSMLFVKLYEIADEYVRVAVRISSSGRCYAKTLHILSTCNAERYIEKGTLKKLDTNSK